MYNTPREAIILGRIDHERRWTGESRFDKIIAEWKKITPKIGEFRDVYGEEINKDQETISDIKKGEDYNEAITEQSIFIEKALMEIINSNNALGEGVNVYPASEFDDLVNSTDFVIRFPGQKKGEFFYLAVDVTISDNPAVVNNKLRKIADRLQNNSLTEVKYFGDKDREPEVKGRICLPRVVINITGDNVRRIQEGFLEKRSYALDEDIRQEIIDEIKKQLEKSTKYLLTNFYDQSADSEIESRGPLNYFKERKLKVKKNPQLYDNVNKHIGVLKYLEKAKENPVP